MKDSESFERPAEVAVLIGDATKARQALGWEARARGLELARIVVEADVEDMRRLLALTPRREGAPACG